MNMLIQCVQTMLAWEFFTGSASVIYTFQANILSIIVSVPEIQWDLLAQLRSPWYKNDLQISDALSNIPKAF